MENHHHHHTTKITTKNRNIFILASSLTLIFALLELTFGLLYSSLLIIGDSIHMMSDASALVLSLIASIVVLKQSSQQRPFGYGRFEIVASFLNGLSLIIIPLIIIYEAITRLINPIDVQGKQMIIIGVIGLVINAVVALILSKAENNLNVESASLHVLADLITSLSAVIAGVGILFFDLTWLDPVGSLITSFIIIRGGVYILKKSFNILMQGPPETIDYNNVLEKLSPFGITSHQDIKIWSISEAESFALIQIDSLENNLKIEAILHDDFDIEPENVFYKTK